MEGKELVIQSQQEEHTQVATAKRYPRNVKECLEEAINIATLDEETAESTWYVLPRKKDDGTFIQGPSVRAAEIMAYSWKNLRAESLISEIGDTHITATGMVFDVERNTAFKVEVKRRITRKDGTRYSDDGITTTCNAACSIAFREAVFKAIPRTFVAAVCSAAKNLSNSNSESLAQKRGRAIDYFQKLGVAKEVLLARLGKPSIEEITAEDVDILRGWRTAIKEGSSIDEFFSDKPAKSALTDKLKKPNLEVGGTHQVVK